MQEAINEEGVGVTPLAIPMIVGPSATVISRIYVEKSTNILEVSFVLFSILIILFDNPMFS